MRQPEVIFEYLKERFGEAIMEFKSAETGQPWILVSPDSIKKIAKFLRDDLELRFNTLMCLSGVHYPNEEEVGVTYHLHSTHWGHSLVIKTRMPIEEPHVQSVEAIWKTANWHEREAWDMVGIKFDGHPNMTRILCPEDWDGHPLRKDYKQQDSYMGISTGV